MTVLLGGPAGGKTTRLVESYRHSLSAGHEADEILCLSFFSANAEAIRQALRPHAGDFIPWVTTLQRFQTLLLRRHNRLAGLPRRTREISPTARGLILRQVWAATNGPLWREFGEAEFGPVPGAVNELVRVIDWISGNRRGFRVLPGELGDHELAQVYRAYIAHTTENGLLTFQEASLRCLDLLADTEIAHDTRRRFPVVLVDDLHLARPDQLELVGRLRGLAHEFVATAWLEPDTRVPELRHAAEVMAGWDEVEQLPSFASPNPSIPALVERLPGLHQHAPQGKGPPLQLHAAFTVEDELHAVAQSIVRALIDDETLRPEAIAVVSANEALLPFAQRLLADYGLPVAAQPPAVRHSPLVRAGLLALRWALLGAEAAVEREILGLPSIGMDPLDLSAVCERAASLETSAVALPPEELTSLELSPESQRGLEIVRVCLASLHLAQPSAVLIETAVASLGGHAWAANDASFPIEQRTAWLAAWVEWLRRVRELEAMPGLAPLSPYERVDLAEQLTDQVSLPSRPDGIRLVPGSAINGVRARMAYVIGLSENAAPARAREIQLIREADLPLLFGGDRSVVVPMARDQAAWLERETRQAAGLLSRGSKRLWVSTSHFTAGGDAQLPSPFFESLLGAEGEIDRHGRLKLSQPDLWQWVEPAPAEAPQAYLPRLSAASAWPRQTDDRQRLLDNHAFSATQVRSYLTCPLQFFYQRVLRIETEGSAALDQGGMLHELLCATVGDGSQRSVNLFDRPRPDWMNSTAELANRTHAVLSAAWDGLAVTLPGEGNYTPSREWGASFGPELQRQAMWRWAERVLANWAEFEVTGLPDRASRRPVLLEVYFALELGDYRLTGRIDRIDEISTAAGMQYEVIDYKGGTSSAVSTAAHLRKFLPEGDKPATDYQLPVYALAVRQGVAGLQALPRRLTLINVEALEKTQKGRYAAKASQTIELTDQAELVYKTGQLPIGILDNEITIALIEVMDRMSMSPYRAQPGFHCGWCSYRSACERGQAEVEAV